MKMMKERKQIVEYGKQIQQSGLTNGTTGNLSIYNPEEGYVAISPSGIPYDKTKIEDIVLVDLDGTTVEGNCKPSSEIDLHLSIYKNKTGARAIVHTHSMYCTVFSCLNRPLQAVHYLLANVGKDTVPVVDYKIYGSKALAKEVSQAMIENNAVLMANHGVIGVADSLQEAVNIVQTCEWIAELQWRCLCVGAPKILDRNQMEAVMNKFQSYGQNENDSNGYTA